MVIYCDPAQLRVGDRLELLKDGQTLEVEVWRLEPAGSAGRRHGAGPAVGAWIRPGGWGVTLDRDTADVHGYRGRVSTLCADCGARVDALEVFPGPRGERCQSCYAPDGEREAAGMTAAELARMWGGR